MAVKTANISLTLGVGAMIPTIEQQIEAYAAEISACYGYQVSYDDARLALIDAASGELALNGERDPMLAEIEQRFRERHRKA